MILPPAAAPMPVSAHPPVSAVSAVLRPASLPWLIWHDVRVKARGREGSIGRKIALVVVALLPLAGGVAAAWHVRDAAVVPVAALGYISVALALAALMMVSSAFAHVVRLGADRGELELLLAAPLPAARVVAARISGVQAIVAAPVLLITLPFFVASAALGHAAWLAGPLVLAAIAVAATAAALLLATLLDRMMGPAQATLVAQISGVVLASAVFALAQTANFAPRWFAAQLAAMAAQPIHPLDWPARALLGDPVPLLAVLAMAALTAWLSTHTAAARIEAAPAQLATERPAAAARFGGSPFAVLFGKEIRLLGRDPELISQIGQQMVFMVPVLALIFTDGQITPARMAAAGVFLGGVLASSLAWLVICGEDVPELIAAAPMPAGAVLRAKLAAALAPPLVLVLLLAAAVATRDVAAALVMLPMAALAGAAACTMQMLLRVPARRSAFRQRYQSSLLTAIGEFILLGSMAAATRMLVAHNWWAGGPLLVAAALLLAIWLSRPRRAA